MYITRIDLIDRFGRDELTRLTDTEGAGVINTDRLASAIDDANSTLDSYLSGRYPTPLSTVPPVLVRIGCDLARYHLYDDHPTEHVTNRYQAAIRFLEQIASAKVTLGVAEPAASSGVGSPQTSTPGRIFNASTLEDF